MRTAPAEVDVASRPTPRTPHVFKRHDGVLSANPRSGERDDWPTPRILALLPTLPNWPAQNPGKRARITSGAHRILQWLSTHPGDGWQDRWLASGADKGVDWIDSFIDPDDTRSVRTQHDSLTASLASLLLCRVVLPSYDFLAGYRAFALFCHAQQVFCPDLFAKLEARALEIGADGPRTRFALVVISKVMLHTGRNADQLTADDLLAFRAWGWDRHGRNKGGMSLAWTMLRGVADLGKHLTLKDAVRYGQRSAAELVDSYQLQCQPVRDLLVRYLDERRASLDYNSFVQLVGYLVGNFWSDIECHHTGIDTLHLPDDVAESWKRRLRTVTNKDGAIRPRKGYLTILIRVRGFYLDLQEWALDDPSWAQWSVPNPVRKGETAGQMKERKKTVAEMHQRVRDRLPRLPVLVDTAEQHKTEQMALLTAAGAALTGRTFPHYGREYRRIMPKAYGTAYFRDSTPPVQIEDVQTGEETDVTKSEHEAFWAWAVIEVLRHTGVRLEELMEITHLGLVSYKLPDTGEVVPMLQIVPSKANEERLLLVGPELASVLAGIITRLRNENGGTVALTARYDPYERVMGPPLPHLLQHRRGAQWAVPATATIYKLLKQTLARAGLRDAAGEPLHYTPHDFRRMFATEAVTGGLPVHIIARLLGHANINTTQTYMAIFDEQLIRAYRTFLDRRRAVRPEVEYREPTEREWQEFQQHFQARQLSLGKCGRPYGTPCQHEHACIRCNMLRLDPKQRPRLVEIITNLKDRIQEAKLNGWLGEVEGLETSLKAAIQKLVSLDRTRKPQPSLPPGAIGIPLTVDP